MLFTEDMGNRIGFQKERQRVREAPAVPKITVTEASPLPAEGPVFTLSAPGPAAEPGRADAPSPEEPEQNAGLLESQVQRWNRLKYNFKYF